MTTVTLTLDAVTYHRAGQMLAALWFGKQFPADVRPNEIAAVVAGGWVEASEKERWAKAGFEPTLEGMAFMREYLTEELANGL
jgi:hypothetical protein